MPTFSCLLTASLYYLSGQTTPFHSQWRSSDLICLGSSAALTWITAGPWRNLLPGPLSHHSWQNSLPKAGFGISVSLFTPPVALHCSTAKPMLFSRAPYPCPGLAPVCRFLLVFLYFHGPYHPSMSNCCSTLDLRLLMQLCIDLSCSLLRSYVMSSPPHHDQAEIPAHPN